jgi:hypothetical protein
VTLTVVFPDVEYASRTWLRAINTSAEGRVYFGNPDHDPPGPWVTLARVGGGPLISEAPADAARVRFDCWAATKFAAYQLAAEVASALFTLTAGTAMGPFVACASELHTVLWAPDPTDNTARYVVDGTLVVRSQS